MVKTVDIYFCGGVTGRKGAWAAILVYKDHVMEITSDGAYVKTTFDRMHLIALIEAVKKLNSKCILRLNCCTRYSLSLKSKHVDLLSKLRILFRTRAMDWTKRYDDKSAMSQLAVALMKRELGKEPTLEDSRRPMESREGQLF